MKTKYKLNLNNLSTQAKQRVIERYEVHEPFGCTPQLLHKKTGRPAGYKWGSLAGMWVRINGEMYTVDSVIAELKKFKKELRQGEAQDLVSLANFNRRTQTEGPIPLRGPRLMYLVHPAILAERFRVDRNSHLWHRPGPVYKTATLVKNKRVMILGIIYNTVDIIELMNYHSKHPDYWETGALKDYWDAVNQRN